jgi:hypothetical protein
MDASVLEASNEVAIADGNAHQEVSTRAIVGLQPVMQGLAILTQSRRKASAIVRVD